MHAKLTIAGEEIARELRPALAALAAAVKKCDKHVCAVEDAYGVERQGKKPFDLEERRARQAMPGPLEALAKIEKEMRQQHWQFLNACRGLLGKPPLSIPKDEHERRRSFRDAFVLPRNKDR